MSYNPTPLDKTQSNARTFVHRTRHQNLI